MQLLLPEMVLVTGIILSILVPNFGDAKFRIPLTRTRLPLLIGGARFKATSDPRVPAWISMFALTIEYDLKAYLQ